MRFQRGGRHRRSNRRVSSDPQHEAVKTQRIRTFAGQATDLRGGGVALLAATGARASRHAERARSEAARSAPCGGNSAGFGGRPASPILSGWPQAFGHRHILQSGGAALGRIPDIIRTLGVSKRHWRSLDAPFAPLWQRVRVGSFEVRSRSLAPRPETSLSAGVLVPKGF